ncbi:flagellar hook-length control protein FliK [Marinomonas alcarazii]|uniref:Flagellar hook-length control protein FliK n=1 Tax=Marinomonas alcarazii TaxID=491949 RepID=A0A318V1T8_9GAMM|nr:flagellar hook-length control protein FliK [Marinomonas alcarazii]PYF81777.1 flagellar hook-length control protein FliK [Marinomonas alcarazii]
MISDIQSMINASSGKQGNANISSNNAVGNSATLAKLMGEIKLIESLSLIKFQGSESLNFQGKPAQLLFATSAQQPFTLINTGTPIDISDIQNAKLNRTNLQQASLSIPVENSSSKTLTGANTPTVKQADNLMLASRVVNLTVTSATPATPPNQSTTSLAPATNTQTPAPQTNTTNQTTSPQTAASSQAPSQATNTPTLNVPLRPANSAPQPTAMVSPNNPQVATVSDGKTEFPILSQTPLKKGDVIRVMVDANNNLQVLPAKANTSTIPSTQAEALKQSLPRQLSLADMSQLVKQLHTLNETSSANLPPKTQQALRQLIQSFPNLGALTTSPDTMKQALQTSGVFSESLLASDNKTQIPADIKLNLSRLKDVQENTGALRLGSIPTEQIANAIERITTSQLRHFSDPNQITTPTYPLHIELPIKNGQTPSFVQIEINKDASSEEQSKQDRRWLVKLKFDFEETGRFDARASIQANKVGVLFAAEDPDTVQKLQKNMSLLKQRLTDKDIEVERLDAFQAKLDKEKDSALKTHSLIDVRT